jgi:enhancer of polycomb-like protein
MSKLSFRARQVDYTKPLPIYLNNDLPDLQDFAAINRSVPQMPTGMEKDEEAEHHLQRALSALQAFGATSTSSQEYAIPTPKVEIDNKMYEKIYNIECPKQKQYIRIQPFSSDFDYPDYDADYEDENWLKEQNKLLPNDFTNDLTLFFETVMDKLEKATGHSSNIISLEEARLLLMIENNDEPEYYFSITSASSVNNLSMHNKYYKEKEEFLLRIYEYWKNKRIKHKHPLTPIVLTDKSGVITQPNNPFLVFRRRTEKMQTRKVINL